MLLLLSACICAPLFANKNTLFVKQLVASVCFQLKMLDALEAESIFDKICK